MFSCSETPGTCNCLCHGYGGGAYHRAQYSKPLTDREKLAATVASLQPGDKVKATFKSPSGKLEISGVLESSGGTLRIRIFDGDIYVRAIPGGPAGWLVALEVLSRALPEEPANLSVILDDIGIVWQRIDAWKDSVITEERWYRAGKMSGPRSWEHVNKGHVDPIHSLRLMVPKS
jgi:hypothetical protein